MNNAILKDKFGAAITDKAEEKAAFNGESNFSNYFSSFCCEIVYSK